MTTETLPARPPEARPLTETEKILKIRSERVGEDLSHKTELEAGPTEELPYDPYNQEGRLRIVIAGLEDNVRDHAIEAANKRLNQDTTQKGMKGFVGRIWKGNIAREYYLDKYTRQAKKDIQENQNLHHHKGGTADHYQEQTTMRFAHEYDDVIHKAAGEDRTLLLDTNEDGTPNPEGAQVKEKIFGLVQEYASGKFKTDQDFEEEKKRLMTELAQDGVAQKFIGEGLLVADNLLQIAQNVRAAVSHHEGIDRLEAAKEILGNSDIVLGNARIGARSEIQANRVERITDKLTKIPFLNESVVATAVSVCYAAGGFAVQRGFGVAAAMTGAVGAGAGVWAGIRENRAVREERTQHARERATGELSSDNLTGRREKLEGALYETETTRGLIDRLGILYDDKGDLRVAGDSARFDEAARIIAETSARIHLSDKQRIDLISYSNPESVEKERFELDLALAKAKVDMRNMMHHLTDEQKKSFAAQSEGLVDATEGVLSASLTAEIRKDIETKDRVFNKLRRSEVGKAALKGTLFGIAGGMVAQEVIAHTGDAAKALLDNTLLGTAVVAGTKKMAEHYGMLDWMDKNSGEQVGVTESVNDKTDKQTLLSRARDNLTGTHSGPEGTGGSAHTGHAEAIVSDATHDVKVNVPDGYNFEKTGNTATVTGPNGFKETLGFKPDGTLDAASERKFQRFGIETNDPITKTTTKEVTANAKQFVDNHKGLTTNVKRSMWYDNDTANIYDKNELRLFKARYDSQGNIVYPTGMKPQGSYHGDTSVNANTLGNQFQMALSASKDTQSQVFMVKIDQNGNAIIPKGDPRQALFAANNKGTLDFTGGYAEAVHVAGNNPDGSLNIRPLATDVGRNQGSFKDTVTTTQTKYSVNYTIKPPAPTGGEVPVLVPPVIPVYGRRGLEEPTQGPVAPTPEGGGGPTTYTGRLVDHPATVYQGRLVGEETPAIGGAPQPLELGGRPEPALGTRPPTEGGGYRLGNLGSENLGPEPLNRGNAIPPVPQAAALDRGPEEQRTTEANQAAADNLRAAARAAQEAAARQKREREEAEANKNKPKGAPEFVDESVRAASQDFLNSTIDPKKYFTGTDRLFGTPRNPDRVGNNGQIRAGSEISFDTATMTTFSAAVEKALSDKGAPNPRAHTEGSVEQHQATSSLLRSVMRILHTDIPRGISPEEQEQLANASRMAQVLRAAEQEKIKELKNTDNNQAAA